MQAHLSFPCACVRQKTATAELPLLTALVWRAEARLCPLCPVSAALQGPVVYSSWAALTVATASNQ